MSAPRTIRAPRGTQLTCKSWLTEAAYRMIQNNLDPEVAERPLDLVVYGGRGQAARSWEAFDAILESLVKLEDDETLLVQSGKPVAVFKTHPDAPRVLIANSNLVPHWATQEHFDELVSRGLMMYLDDYPYGCTEQVVSRALAKEPATRYQRVDELLADIEKLLLKIRLEGPIVEQLTDAFADDWLFTTGEKLLTENWFPPRA